VTVATFGVSLAVMYGLKAMGILRVSKEGELEGIDVHEHGGTAYPELMSGVGTMPMESKSVPAAAGVVISASAE